jgi:hypothetical protein|tara:strand:+ start:113 stop:379 length:267 start_codon:yes stop_codon:yes gene_type:complete
VNKVFLDKVIYQIVSETKIVDNDGRIWISLPYYPEPQSSTSNHFLPFYMSDFFSRHSEDIYSLNKEETKYVWRGYIEVIKDKITKQLV